MLLKVQSNYDLLKKFKSFSINTKSSLSLYNKSNHYKIG